MSEEEVLRRQRALEQERPKFMYQKRPEDRLSVLGGLVAKRMCSAAPRWRWR